MHTIFPAGGGGGGGGEIGAKDVIYNDHCLCIYLYTSICLLRFTLFA